MLDEMHWNLSGSGLILEITMNSPHQITLLTQLTMLSGTLMNILQHTITIYSVIIRMATTITLITTTTTIITAVIRLTSTSTLLRSMWTITTTCTSNNSNGGFNLNRNTMNQNDLNNVNGKVGASGSNYSQEMHDQINDVVFSRYK